LIECSYKAKFRYANLSVYGSADYMIRFGL
jgi:hypothetical protein